MEQIKLVYRRIPDRTIVRFDQLIERRKDFVVALSMFEGLKSPIRINGKIVIANGFYMLYFAPINGNYDILKVYTHERKLTGFYCDVLDYVRFSEDTLEMLDLFLDIWISPEGDYLVLDREELEEAFKNGYIKQDKYTKANVILRKLLSEIEKGTFPPQFVKDYSLDFLDKEHF